ncbi:NFACT family protein [Lysinibacillus sp. HST-98]|uniref:Rqc2 family fibronectin-binding protein n=1 Tax=Lysinibacillus TaxID=400634 RepID=UPI001928D3C3|nr:MULTISPECIES: NFACT RNA binding domain-containing protein [Lysinibacillus]MBL3731040.1 NFACT family protein [Lysinibacillus sp. HST-98]MED4701570.1 NFACT RNA binding domain-containing protein [Lysinibacillus capsici]
MAFDGLFTYSITADLQQLVTGRITKIHQPNAQEVILHVRANGKNHKLLFSIHSSYARVHLTEHVIENPAEPPMFCMLLRKHIEGGFIASIKQRDFDRIIIVEIESKNEIGDPIVREIHAEIMGRHSNLLLIDQEQGKIIDSLKHLPPSVNSFRTVLPGQPYIAPPSQNKWNPLTVTDEELTAFFAEGKTSKELVQQLAGFSPLHAEELLYRMKKTSNTLACFKDFMTSFANGGMKPMYVLFNHKVHFSPIELTHLHDGDITIYPNVHELLDRVFFARAERDRVKQQAGDLERWLQNEIDKLALKTKKLTKDYERASKLDQFQLYGELLMANIYAFEKGVKEVTVTNYYSETGEEITIPVSERKTPIENAQSYYTKYTKAKNALVMVQEQLEKTTDEISYFEMLAQQVQQASPGDIEEIREELAEQGYLKLRHAKKKKKQAKPEPERYVSSTGVIISVGKNNKQNDMLTFKLAKRTDIWLHTKDIPGSHVVIHSSEPDETTLREAATLAAYFSKARESSSVPVDYTEIKQVKKPNGAKPGFVIYFEQKTLYIDPDETVILQLKKQS